MRLNPPESVHLQQGCVGGRVRGAYRAPLLRPRRLRLSYAPQLCALIPTRAPSRSPARVAKFPSVTRPVGSHCGALRSQHVEAACPPSCPASSSLLWQISFSRRQISFLRVPSVSLGPPTCPSLATRSRLRLQLSWPASMNRYTLQLSCLVLAARYTLGLFRKLTPATTPMRRHRPYPDTHHPPR